MQIFEGNRWRAILGFVCPRCRAVVKRMGFSFVCIDHKCWNYGYAVEPITVVHRFGGHTNA